MDVPAWRRRFTAEALGVVPFTALKGIDDVGAISDSLRDCRGEPFEWWLLNLTTAELVRPRCKAPNRCSHCRELGARETVEMIDLAAEEAPPTLYMVLTCSEFISRAELRRDLCQIRRSARRIWPDFEYFCAIEWQARGAIHVNLLLRGPSVGAAALALKVVYRVWRRRHRTVWVAQSCSPITSAREAGAYVHKLGQYLAKDDQSAPPGWRGHRSSQTRGFLPRPASEMRAEAVLSLRWKAIRAPLLAAGVRPLEASWRAADELAVRVLDQWARYPVEGPGTNRDVNRRRSDGPGLESLHETTETVGAPIYRGPERRRQPAERRPVSTGVSVSPSRAPQIASDLVQLRLWSQHVAGDEHVYVRSVVARE